MNQQAQDRRSFIAVRVAPFVVTRRLAAVGVGVNKAMAADEASPLYVPVQNGLKAVVDKLLETAAVDVNTALTADGAHCCRSNGTSWWSASLT